ncbi:hypothetical protein Vadar_013040 [Vaccinium darrowii]|uniref:Uncharacterized protein n=1 Tax=Vaccinium darrowii TaxID=229202 RepID=A0ACB7Y7R2_9ERIC|nr:hypothetical protein Vadar_013040 [Vaccinium darrowii]
MKFTKGERERENTRLCRADDDDPDAVWGVSMEPRITTLSDRKQIQLRKPIYVMLILTPKGSIFLHLTAEDASGIHIWDLRMPKFPILELPGHPHWARHNIMVKEDMNTHFLAECRNRLSGQLWLASLPSINDLSSESLVESPTRQIDPLLNSYSDYEDSVYGVACSSREPWMFASLSYDGRVRAGLSYIMEKTGYGGRRMDKTSSSEEVSVHHEPRRPAGVQTPARKTSTPLDRRDVGSATADDLSSALRGSGTVDDDGWATLMQLSEKQLMWRTKIIYAFHAAQKLAETSVESTKVFRCLGNCSFTFNSSDACYFAKIAGCKIVVLATPPTQDGSTCKEVLYSAKRAGITHILKAGGAPVVKHTFWILNVVVTISAMACGTATCPKSAGTDSAVNLWLASLPSSNDLSLESLVESPTRRIDPLLNSYSDYEDTVYADCDNLRLSPSSLNVYT